MHRDACGALLRCFREFWMNFQVSYELRLKRRELPETLAAITPEITFLSQVLWQLRPPGCTDAFSGRGGRSRVRGHRFPSCRKMPILCAQLADR